MYFVAKVCTRKRRDAVEATPLMKAHSMETAIVDAGLSIALTIGQNPVS
jgi:hypothetical protein